MDAILANWGRRSGQPMSDEQRKAMFAHMGGGGGGGGGSAGSSATQNADASALAAQYERMRAAGIDIYDGDKSPSWWDKTKAFFGGAVEGARGGSAIVRSKLTFGASDALARTRFGQATGMIDSTTLEGGDYDFSRGAATVARESLLAALGIGALSKLGAAWKGTRLAQTAAGEHARLLSAVGGFASKYGIDSYRENNPTINPVADKFLAMASQIAGYVGSIGLLGSLHQYGRAALSGTKLAAAGKSLLAGIDKGLSAPFKWLGGKMPAPVAAALKKAHGAYSAFSDFTGASIKDLATKPATKMDWFKKAYVATGMAAVAVRDELAIGHYQKERASALREGRDFTIPSDSPRGLAGTLGSMAVGTTGNPIEKLFRPGLQTYQASVGAYRADYDAIKTDQKAGRITAQQANAALERLAENKPRNIQGKEIWQFAPAAAAFVNWQAGDAMAEARRSTVDVRQPGQYADADTLALRGNTVRMSDMNAPEVPHAQSNDPDHPERRTGEYLGAEAQRRIQELVKENQYVRLVEDSNPKAGGFDKYGRAVRTVETLPKPFDQLLRVPYLGKVIPARDVNKTLIREGLADIHYRELSGRGDRQEAYDAARAKAQAEKIGIWSDQGRAALPWVGTEKTVEDRRQANFQRQKGQPLPYPQWGNIADKAGLGLMTTGNSGIFGMMPKSGTGAAQAWNAALAVLGSLQYNERARSTLPRSPRAPAVIKSDWQRAQEARLGHELETPRGRGGATAAELRALDAFLSGYAP